MFERLIKMIRNEERETKIFSGYGFCPLCGARGCSRERRMNGNDSCENGHIYPSADSVKIKKEILE